VPEQVDPWISIGATPVSKYFALFHDQDHLVVGIRLNLTAGLDMERLALRCKRSSASRLTVARTSSSRI